MQVMLEECLLCGEHIDKRYMMMTPPTAAARVLSIDGGGIRGIIPLAILRQIVHDLREFGLPLADFFDLACGTSAGK